MNTEKSLTINIHDKKLQTILYLEFIACQIKKISNLKYISFIYDLLLIGKIAPLHQNFDKNNYLIL